MFFGLKMRNKVPVLKMCSKTEMLWVGFVLIPLTENIILNIFLPRSWQLMSVAAVLIISQRWYTSTFCPIALLVKFVVTIYWRVHSTWNCDCYVPHIHVARLATAKVYPVRWCYRLCESYYSNEFQFKFNAHTSHQRKKERERGRERVSECYGLSINRIVA